MKFTLGISAHSYFQIIIIKIIIKKKSIDLLHSTPTNHSPKGIQYKGKIWQKAI